MNRESENGNVPPFVDSALPSPQGKTTQSMRMITMMVGLGALSIAMIAGGKLLWEILDEGLANNLDTIGAKLLWVAVPFVVGWIASLMSTRTMNNLVLPLIIRYFIWFTLIGILALYARVIQKLYMEAFFASHYLRYSLVFVAGFTALVGLHLLIEDHDLRPFSIPLLIMTLIHLFVAVLHYVFQEGNPAFAIGDLVYFAGMLFIVILMGLHLGLLNPLRRSITRLFEGGPGPQ
jgi:hypothetical protein